MSTLSISSTTPPVVAPTRLKNLFNTPGNAALTITLIVLLAVLGWYLLRWGVLFAVLEPNAEICRRSDGACWGAIVERGRMILLGRFPVGESWRPVLAMLLLSATIGLAALPRFFNRTGLMMLLGGLAAFVLLMRGDFAGMSKVTSDLWGGLPLTLFLAATACLVGVPLGIVLALGRRSTLPIVRWLSTTYIETIRAIPLITLLFFGAFVLPLLLPPQFKWDAMIRIALCLIAFEAAYIAEVVRGGLQAIPRGQYEAAQALGLTRLQALRLVVLPQALRLVIGPTANNIIGVIKNTSLVAIVNVYDLTGALKLSLADPTWKIFFIEQYLLVCAVYLLLGILIASYGRFLEQRYALHHR